MLRRENGLDYFFQWDYNQRLIVDDNGITEVHFCNKITTCSYVCETYTEDTLLLVNVPNILLQEDWEIEAYAYIGNCIKSSERFDIVSRAKPDNYIYEETEILNYDTLVSRMDTIEDSIPGAVADYMEANPIKFPVDSVNGKTGAVKLAAADVGALPADTVIPSTVGLATEKYVDDAVAASKPDLSGYATKNDISGLATTNYVDEKVSGVEVDLSDYATKTFVSEEIAKIEVGESADLTNYYTKSETDTAIGEAVAAIPQPDLTNYATTGYVDEKVAAIDIPEVEIDGKRIIKNDEGKLSTSVGGAVIRDYTETPYFDWVGSVGITDTLDSSTATIDNIDESFRFNSQIVIVIDGKEYINKDVSATSLQAGRRLMWNLTNCPVSRITCMNTTGAITFTQNGDLATGSEVITGLKISVVEDNGYTFEKLCGHCIPVGNGLAISGDERLLVDGVPEGIIEIDEDYVKNLVGGNSSSVAVDGETILQNADGTISTAVGGYRTEPQVIYTWTGSTPAGEEVDEPEIAPFEGLSVDDTITITYTIDGAEYTEEFNVDTKSSAKIIASNNDDGLLTEVVIGIRYETMTYEFEGTALTAVSISDNGGYVCINSNYINIGAGLERSGAKIAVDDAYIEDLISDAGVPVDGTTIIANGKGRISTSIGGAVITTPDEEYFNYTDEFIVLIDNATIDATLADSYNLEDLEDGTDVIVRIADSNGEEYEIETTVSNDGTTVSMNLSSEPIFSNFVYTIKDETFVLAAGADATDEEITDIVIAVPGSVAYEQIDSNVVNIGTGLKINERGSIAVDAAYIESIIANYLATTGV